MRPAYTTDPLATALVSATVVVWVVFEVQQALRRRSDAVNTDRHSLVVLRACMTGGVVLAVLALRLPTAGFGYTPLSLLAAMVCLWTGLGLRIWSVWTLGRYFTFSVMTSRDQPVISTGPYQYLRHPSYTGILLCLL